MYYHYIIGTCSFYYHIYIYSLYYHILIIIILSYYDMLSFVCIQSDLLSYVIWSFIVNIYDLIWYTCSCHSCRSAFFQVTERIQSEALGPVVQVSKVTIVARNAAWQGSVKHRFSGLNGGFLWFPKIGDTPRSKFGWFIFIYLYYIYMVYTYIYI